MKKPADWINQFSNAFIDHPCGCICDRCNNGREVFLINSDIEEIQKDAREDYERLLKIYKHSHVSNGIDDKCKKCGLDLRNEIHKRFN